MNTIVVEQSGNWFEMDASNPQTAEYLQVDQSRQFSRTGVLFMAPMARRNGTAELLNCAQFATRETAVQITADVQAVVDRYSAQWVHTDYVPPVVSCPDEPSSNYIVDSIGVRIYPSNVEVSRSWEYGVLVEGRGKRTGSSVTLNAGLTMLSKLGSPADTWYEKTVDQLIEAGVVPARPKG